MNPVADVLSRQLIRSATSVGANYPAACRGRSVPDVLARLGVVEEEADETMYWLEMLVDAGVAPQSVVFSIHKEADEIVAMTVASIKTLRASRNPKSKIENPKSRND
jgi:four helix bundle protein